MWKSIRQKWNTVRLLRESFGLALTVPMMAQVVSGRSIVRTRIPSIRTPVYWRRKNSDLSALLQIFGRADLAIALNYEPAFIIDAGANVGFSSLYFANRYRNAKVVAIEPEQANCSLFRRNCQAYGNIQLIEAGLLNRRAFTRIENPQGKSWEFRLAECTKNTPGSIPTITINDILRDCSTTTIDILKMDVEGSEREIFQNGCH
jgi:FkbM family methyltransferase